MSFNPMPGLTVTVMGRKTAERHQRMAYCIPDNVGMWEPYTVLVQRDCRPWTAFHSVKDLKRWLGGRYRLALQRRPRTAARYSLALGSVEEA